MILALEAARRALVQVNFLVTHPHPRPTTERPPETERQPWGQCRWEAPGLTRRFLC